MIRLLLMTACICFIGCSQDAPEQPAYTTAKIRKQNIEVSVRATGVVEPLTTVEVKSKASGEVLEVAVESGDVVKEGRLIVQIDPRTVQNRLAQAEAELVAAEANRKVAATQMQRSERLRQTGTVSESAIEDATLDLANADANLVSARVAVENARIAVDDTDIRAPITGTVLNKPVEKGQVISSPTQDVSGGTVLLSMADLSAVQIRTMVDETDIGKVSPGIPARVTVAAFPDQPFYGTVSKIEPEAVVEQNITMFATLIVIQNPDRLLLPGMNSDVEITVARADSALAVPVMALRTQRDVASTAKLLDRDESELRIEVNAALARFHDPANRPNDRDLANIERDQGHRPTNQFWVMLEEDGTPRARSIEIGITDLDQAEVLSGLDVADTVLILPSSHMFETQQQLQSAFKARIPGARQRGK
ncbi:MAG: efflux RND transporter periplasmic adaptor subunit [Pseudomonadota bacterium]